jgi:histidinol-phosphate aminotransferase
MPLVPPYISSLQPYLAGMSVAEVCRRYGLPNAVKLASNENPLGPSPLALEAMKRVLDQSARYPSGGTALREVLADRFGVAARNVIPGSGSEGILSNIIRTFLCDGDEVLTADITFIGFRVLAESRGIAYRTVPLRDWRFDLAALAGAVNERTKIIYLANPNNPTGTTFTRTEFEAFYRRIPERVLIILDEAYYEYVSHLPGYPDSMRYRYDNVITLRTFSKAYGLAGVRLGYGFAHETLIENLLKVKLPFEPSSPAEAAGIAALGDTAFLAETLRTNACGMSFLTGEFASLGIRFLPSHANFLMTLWPSATAAAEVVESLLQSGVIVRPLAAFGLPRGVRISIGTPQENQILVSALRRIQKPRLQECALCS